MRTKCYRSGQGRGWRKGRLALVALALMAGGLGPVLARSEASADCTTILSFQSGGLEREACVFVPDSLGSNPPVVMVLHGGGGDAKAMAKRMGFNPLASKAKFLAVYPQGYKGNWNAGDCGPPLGGENCGGPAYRKNIDDVGFLENLIDRLAEKYGINKRRVYATGFSNGGMMVYRLACQRPDLVAAIAPVEGAFTQPADECINGSPVPLLAFHAENDQNVPFGGGSGACTKGRREYPAVDRTQAWWWNHNGCTEDVIATGGSGPVSCQVACPGTHRAVGLCKVDITDPSSMWGGHSWPGTEATRHCLSQKQDKDKCPCKPVSFPATDKIWEFFSNKVRG